MALDPYLPCDVSRQSGGSTQIPSLRAYGRNPGTDTYQIQERFKRNSITEDVDEFGKVGAETSNLQSQMHPGYDSAESIADSDLELRKILVSPLYRQD